jgi:hypothetical protein
MTYDARGNFVRVHNWEQDRLNNIEIASDRHDEEDDNFAEGLSKCLLRDGRAAMTGNLDLNNYRIKNVATGTANGDAVNKGQMDTALNTKDAAVVHLSGTETVTGTKTFSIAPIVPTPDVDSNTTVPATTAYINTKFQKVNSLPATPDADTFYFIQE